MGYTIIQEAYAYLAGTGEMNRVGKDYSAPAYHVNMLHTCSKMVAKPVLQADILI